jgi:hypothetical protein
VKSAYELAMERMEAESGPSRKLSESEKARIAEIDSLYDAKIAETKLSFEPRIAATPPPDADDLKAQLVAEIASFEEKRERDKEEVWNSA